MKQSWNSTTCGLPASRSAGPLFLLPLRGTSFRKSRVANGGICRRAVDPEKAVQTHLTGAAPHREIRQRREPAAPLIQIRDAREHPRPQRRAVLLVVVRQKLVLDLGQIDVRGALALAAFALQAQVEHVVHALGGELLRRQRSRQSGAQRVGAAARRVLLVERGVIGGAHRAHFALAAHARAVAHLDRPRETALARKIEVRFDLDRLVVGAPAQVVGQLRSARPPCPGS